MPHRSLHVDDVLYQYLMTQSIREHPAQVALRAATVSHPHAGMQISPDQVHVFQALPRLTPEAKPAMRRIASFIAHALRDTRIDQAAG